MSSKVVVDSELTFDQAVAGSKAPKEIIETLELIDVEYWSFDRKMHKGQLLLHRDYAKEIKEVFLKLTQYKFPIEKVIPVVNYDWDDKKSMQDNNSSAFNYRSVPDQDILSQHSYGCAIDINPLVNPYFEDNNKWPEGAIYDVSAMGVITANDLTVRAFEEKGWFWGGYWSDCKDFQHFEKPHKSGINNA